MKQCKRFLTSFGVVNPSESAFCRDLELSKSGVAISAQSQRYALIKSGHGIDWSLSTPLSNIRKSLVNMHFSNFSFNPLNACVALI